MRTVMKEHKDYHADRISFAGKVVDYKPIYKINYIYYMFGRKNSITMLDL